VRVVFGVHNIVVLNEERVTFTFYYEQKWKYISY